MAGEYRAYNCNTAHCVSCHVLWASCEDLDDGLHPWTKGEGHVHWLECLEGRNVDQGRCDSHDDVPHVFSKQSLTCVPYDGQFTFGYG